MGRKQAPEVQQMYTLSLPVSTIRTKIRQEFERHRYVKQLQTVDVLLFNSHQEFQVWVSYDTTTRDLWNNGWMDGWQGRKANPTGRKLSTTGNSLHMC